MTNIDMIQRIFKGAFNFELCSELKQVACYVCYIPYGDDINTICSYDEEEITEEGMQSMRREVYFRMNRRRNRMRQQSEAFIPH